MPTLIQSEKCRTRSILTRAHAPRQVLAHYPGRTDRRLLLELAIVGLRTAMATQAKLLRGHLTRPARTQLSLAHAAAETALGATLMRRGWGGEGGEEKEGEKTGEKKVIASRRWRRAPLHRWPSLIYVCVSRMPPCAPSLGPKAPVRLTPPALLS